MANADPVIKQWMTLAAIGEAWSTWLNELLENQRTIEFGERFARFCPCSEAMPEDYLPREIQIDPDLSVIAGINEYHGFFVRVHAQSRMLTPEEHITVGNKLLDSFSVFKPMGVRWWLPKTHNTKLDEVARSDQNWLLVGHIPTLSESLPARIGVMRKITKLETSFYAAYTAMYERFYTEAPQMRDVVRTESEDSLRSCARSGALFSYEVDEKPAGVFAARIESEPPISGWYAVEAILDTAHRGRGIATSAMSDMFRSLHCSRSELVLATIAAVNQPSFRAARRAGLHEVGKWVTLEQPVRSVR